MPLLPLEGITVLEFTHTVMGPSCGVVLADLGADVIRVEPAPDGDRTRRHRRPTQRSGAALPSLVSTRSSIFSVSTGRLCEVVPIDWTVWRPG